MLTKRVFQLDFPFEAQIHNHLWAFIEQIQFNVTSDNCSAFENILIILLARGSFVGFHSASSRKETTPVAHSTGEENRKSRMKQSKNHFHISLNLRISSVSCSFFYTIQMRTLQCDSRDQKKNCCKRSTVWELRDKNEAERACRQRE